jgi:hypothetical protein
MKYWKQLIVSLRSSLEYNWRKILKYSAYKLSSSPANIFWVQQHSRSYDISLLQSVTREVQITLQEVLHRAWWPRGTVLDLYLGGAPFEYRLRHRLYRDFSSFSSVAAGKFWNDISVVTTASFQILSSSSPFCFLIIWHYIIQLLTVP